MAFRGCSSLETILIPNSVVQIGEGAFAECESLSYINIPDKLTKIPKSLFAYCSSLATIAIPDNVKRICEEAFFKCSSLSSISLPASVDLESRIFISCNSLSSVTVTKGTGIMRRWDFTEYIPETDCGDIEETASVLADIQPLETIIVSEGVKSLSKFAFSYCKSLVSVILPSSLEMIDTAVFEGCTALKSITMPMDVKVVRNIFEGCESLSSFTIIKGIEKHTNEVIDSGNFSKDPITSAKDGDEVFFDYDYYAYYYKKASEPFSFSKKKIKEEILMVVW